MVRISEVELLNKAEIEEKYYNWEDAAKLYEQAAKLFLDKKMFEDAAKEVDLFRLRSERKKWEIEQLKDKRFIQSTR